MMQTLMSSKRIW